MLYQHKKSGDLYRKIIESFSVERQKHSIVYMSMLSGEVFDRDAEAFNENFKLVGHPQLGIKPKPRV